jgi:hypothetical protein
VRVSLCVGVSYANFVCETRSCNRRVPLIHNHIFMDGGDDDEERIAFHSCMNFKRSGRLEK